MTFRTASTVLIMAPVHLFKGKLPDPKKGNYRLFMIKRAKTMSFQPNAVVFPGGACDPCDFDQQWAPLLSLSKIEPETGRRIAAVREVFEETGILLVTNTDVASKWTRQERDSWRADVHKDGNRFIDLCRRIHAAPDIDALIKFANWITPPVEKKRFDTHFYVAVARPDSTVVGDAAHDLIESQGSAWATPDETLAAWRRRQILLLPPTWLSLRELSLCYPTLASVTATMRKNKTTIHVILPHLLGFSDEDGAVAMALPGDCAHPDTPKIAALQVLPDVSKQRHRILIRGNIFGDKSADAEKDNKPLSQQEAEKAVPLFQLITTFEAAAASSSSKL